MTLIAVDTFMNIRSTDGFYMCDFDIPMRNLHNRETYQLSSDYIGDTCCVDRKIQASILVNEKYDKYDRDDLVKQFDDERELEEQLLRKDLLNSGIVDISDYLTIEQLIDTVYSRFKIKVPEGYARRAVKKYCRRCRGTDYYPRYRLPRLADLMIEHYRKSIYFIEDEGEFYDKIKRKRFTSKVMTLEDMMSRYREYIKFNKPVDPMEINAGVPVHTFFPRSHLSLSELKDHNDLLFRSTPFGDFHMNKDWADGVTVEFKLFRAIYIKEGKSFLYNEFSGDIEAFCTKFRLDLGVVNLCLDNIELQCDGWIFHYI